MSDQRLKDAVRLGVLKGLTLGPDPCDAHTEGKRYDCTFMVETVYEAIVGAFIPETPAEVARKASVNQWLGDDGWQLAHDVRKQEARQHMRQVQYEDGEWSREME